MTVVVVDGHAGRAVESVAAVAPCVTTVPAVAQTMMAVGLRSDVVATALIVAAASVAPPAVASAIGDVDGRTAEVEVVAPRIACVDSEMPVAGAPVERTVEICGCAESVPLPVQEDVAQVEIAA